MDPENLYDLFLNSQGVSTDTRSLRPGELFIALKGPNFNANSLAAQAVEKGCLKAIIDDPAYEIKGSTVLVEDCLKTLQSLGRYHRRQCEARIIGITGSNGKTTTKELISAVLSTGFRIISTKGNLNNHIGVPLTLLQIRPDTEIAVIEMGANHAGEIAELCEIAEPDFGLITSIGKAHLEGFGDIETIKHTKAGLYRFCLSHGGTCFVHATDPLVKGLYTGDSDQVVYYGDPYLPMVSHVQDRPEGIELRIRHEGGETQIRTNLSGTYNAANILGAWTIGTYFGLDVERMAAAISAYTPSNNRSEIRTWKGNTLIMDAYNANPTSMRLALEDLVKKKGDRKLAILGDMMELGPDSAQEHLAIISMIRENGLEAITVGELFLQAAGHEKGDIRACQDLEQAKSRLETLNPVGYTILVKGSRKSTLEKIFT